MQRDEVLKIANDMAFMACIWIDDEGNEVNDLVKFAQLVASKQQARIEMLKMEITALEEKLDEARDIIAEQEMNGIWNAIKIEREECAKRADIALLGTLKTTSDRVLMAIRKRGEA